MELTRERALKLHRRMWIDMQQELGDNPSKRERVIYKKEWCEKHFPNKLIFSHCFLCQYVYERHGAVYSICAGKCPIIWINNNYNGDYFRNDEYTRCEDYRDIHWSYMPISQLLALPEREFDEVN